jgi:hypothetical protein
MKTVLNYIWSVFDSFGRARAASHLARIGQYEAARRVMTE